MTEPIKTINKFAMQEILRSDRELDYDCFYKRQIAEMVEALREDYKEIHRQNQQLKHILDELEKWLEENWQQNQDIWFVKIINKIKELRGRE